jgi:YD repeat-containing protein
VNTASPDTGVTTQAWDAAGNRVFRRDAEDQALSYVYDELNRLTQVTYPSAADNILYSYDDGTDGMGRITGVMDPSGGTGFVYDARGHLVEKTVSREGESLALSRQFTLAVRQSSQTYPLGRVLTFERRDCA